MAAVWSICAGRMSYPTGSRCVWLYVPYAPLDCMSNFAAHMVVHSAIKNKVKSAVVQAAAALNTVT